MKTQAANNQQEPPSKNLPDPENPPVSRSAKSEKAVIVFYFEALLDVK